MIEPGGGMDGTLSIADAGGVYAGVSETLERARGLPGRAYTEPAVFDAEIERVLRAGWLPVARASEVANPGDYTSRQVAGAPLLVTRDEAGAIHVLSRVCRHRGMPVVDGAGNAAALMCPYHLWRYGLDGALLSAAGMKGSEVFVRAECGLKRIRSETWCGWVFANLDGAAPPLAAQLGSLTDRAAKLDGYVTAGVLTFDSPWNWKVMVENFMESYHHIGPHAATLQQTNPGLGTYPGEGSGAFAMLENPAADGGDGFLVAAVFPLTLLFVSGTDGLAGWYEMTDLSHSRFSLRIHLLTSPERAADPAFVEAAAAQLTTIHLEDIPACEGIQKGVSSPLYEPGPLSPLEACLWRFHRHLQARFR
jgi:phenylpropionate dioxygenase-like ring-hydroxylating dioxygenase large terminal subunit